MLKVLSLFFITSISFHISAQNMERVKSNIDTLCSPYMAGRGYIDEGDKKAAQFIAAQFKQIGLKSFTEDYFQSFSFPINNFPKKLRLKLDKKELTLGTDFIINPVSSKARGNKKIYYLDTLLFSDKNLQKEFLATNLKNKVLVYHSRFYKAITDMPVQFVKKMYEAKAVIELESKLTATVSTKAIKSTIFEADSTVFRQQPKRAKFKVQNELIEKYTSQNVLGYIEGSEYPEKFLVVSAHYDHLGKMGNIYFPGANDNASGISMLLELAHYYQKNKPKYSMVFIAFGGEEAGLLGSQFYTENPLFPLSSIRFLVNLDLVGTGDDGITVVNGSLFTEGFELLQDINFQYNYLPAINKRGAAANSDHYFFTVKKVPSFFIYTLGGIKAYHDINDKASTLPLTAYKEVFGLLTQFLDKI